MAATVATLERWSPQRSPVALALRDELAALDADALAERLERLAEEEAALHAALAFGVRRLAAFAAAAAEAAAQRPDERIDIEGVMRLTGRSRSWIEHHPHAIPGRLPGRRGGRAWWLKSAVVRGLATGGC